MLAIALTERDWSGQRATISPPQFGRLVDIHLSHTRMAEDCWHDQHGRTRRTLSRRLQAPPG